VTNLSPKTRAVFLADRLRDINSVVCPLKPVQFYSSDVLLRHRVALRGCFPVLAQIQERTVVSANVAENSGEFCPRYCHCNVSALTSLELQRGTSELNNTLIGNPRVPTLVPSVPLLCHHQSARSWQQHRRDQTILFEFQCGVAHDLQM